MVCERCLLVILTLQGTTEGAPKLGCFLVRGLWVPVFSPFPNLVCWTICWELLPGAGRLPTLRGR